MQRVEQFDFIHFVCSCSHNTMKIVNNSQSDDKWPGWCKLRVLNAIKYTHRHTTQMCSTPFILAKSIRAGKATIEGNSGGPALYITDYDHKLKKDIQHEKYLLSTGGYGAAQSRTIPTKRCVIYVCCLEPFKSF